MRRGQSRAEAGMDLYNRGRYADAARCFEASLRQDPAQEWVICALGRALAFAGRVPAALRLLRDAARKAKDPHPIFLALADILGRAGRPEQAQALLRRLVEQSAHLSQAHQAFGELMLGQGRLEEAEASLRRAVKLDPSLPWPHMALGEALERGGRWEKARRCWAAAGRARLCNAAADLKLGDIHLRQGLAQQAERHYLRAWKKEPSGAACRRLGELCKGQGRFAEAVRWFERALRFEPQAALLDFKLGWICGQAGRWPVMRSHLRRYLRRRGPADGEAPALAWVCLQDYRRAAAAAEAALAGLGAEGLAALSRAWPENWLRQHGESFYAGHLRVLERQAGRMPGPWPAFFKAAILLRRGRFAQAAACAGELARFPAARYGWMRYVTGLAALQACRYGQAEADLSAAVRCRPDDWKARCHLAETLLCLGKTAAAFSEFDAAEARAARAGAACEVWAWRGEARLWLGQVAEALQDLDRAVSAGARLALCWRGAALLLSGRGAPARRDLDLALVPGSRDAEAYIWRAELHRRAGRLREALADLGRAQEAGKPDCEWVACNAALSRGGGLREDIARLSPALAAAAADVLKRPVPDVGDRAGWREFLEAMLACARGLRRHEPYLRALWLGPEAAARLGPG